MLLLVLLFRIIARASDDFFSCILSQISQDLGLPPRLGGVTLLALGNGAPDLSASIEAVKTGAPAGSGCRLQARAGGRGGCQACWQAALWKAAAPGFACSGGGTTGSGSSCGAV